MIRAHKGVDYAAPTGTIIKAAGDGRVSFVGSKGGYGRVVIIEHGGGISTLYGHMSRFARGLSAGDRVKQGITIGYVGSSGAATGPHLHYEYRVNGVHRNPQTVKLGDARPIADELKTDFTVRSAPLLAELDLINRGPLLADR
jgi:murein DD-endopeptidase MepM/ murein hydrolase activator NlpD